MNRQRSRTSFCDLGRGRRRPLDAPTSERKKRAIDAEITASIGLLSAALLATLAAHAAPSTPSKPSVLDPKVQRPGGLATLKPIELEITQSTVRCNQPYTVTAKVSHKVGSGWTGNVVLSVGGVTKKEPVSVSSAQPTRSAIVISSAKLDCHKALPTIEVSAVPDGSDAPTATKTLKASKVNGVTSGNAQPSAPSVWLRRVEIAGTCGGGVTGTAHIMGTGAALPPNTGVTFTWGGETKAANGNAVPATQINVFTTTFTAPPVDCQAATGPAGLGFNYTGPTPLQGTINVGEVVYAV